MTNLLYETIVGNTHCMIDIETMSTNERASILAIGAVKFDIETGITDTFSMNISRESNEAFNRHFCPNTTEWWAQQDQTVFETLSVDAVTLPEAIAAFEKWYGDEPKMVWAKGVTFDITILDTAFSDVFQRDPPWKFWEIMCYRTTNSMFDVEPDYKNEHLHVAVEDARHQALHLIKIIKTLKGA